MCSLDHSPQLDLNIHCLLNSPLGCLPSISNIQQVPHRTLATHPSPPVPPPVFSNQQMVPSAAQGWGVQPEGTLDSSLSLHSQPIKQILLIPSPKYICESCCRLCCISLPLYLPEILLILGWLLQYPPNFPVSSLPLNSYFLKKLSLPKLKPLIAIRIKSKNPPMM